jgi:hypothetical protein
MISSHLLYQTELSFVAQETGIEPMPSGLTPTLAMSYVLHPCNGGTRSRKPARASRDHSEPEPMAKARERGNKGTSASWQAPARDFFWVAVFAMMRRSQSLYTACRHPRMRVTQYPRDGNDRAEKPRRTGSPHARGRRLRVAATLPRHCEKQRVSAPTESSPAPRGGGCPCSCRRRGRRNSP